ncbi:MAG: helix-turn-helix transcriptional regulator [Acholeplasmatales bacterium]|jgi:YesN/AraC family two-component response regulator|nr:helix-turn-helix transcriptional regulator [Acholeplasmatales bacterium]
MENYEFENEYLIQSSYLLELQLVNAIEVGDLTLANSLLEEINKKPKAKLSEDELRSIKNSVICSCCLFCRAIIKAGVKDEIAFKLSDIMILEIEKINNKEEVLQFEFKMLERYIKKSREKLVSSYSNVTIKAMQYINKNVKEKLSLDIICKNIFISPPYLSSAFKKETGTTITKYINKIKALESTFYLKHTNLEIGEICYLYNFCNESYYTNVFKSIYDMTPSNYRDFRED